MKIPVSATGGQGFRPGTADDPAHWLGSSPLLDLEDPRLRLRTRALTQLCKSEREKALAVYAFVKRIPFAKPFKMRLRTAREVIDARRGDASDKATVLVALNRLAGIPARVRYLLLRAELLQGLRPGARQAACPVVETWLGERWVQNDTYIFDAGYVAAARARLKDRGWERGYGIHVQGQALWDGARDASVGGLGGEDDPMVLADLGVYGDPLAFVSSAAYREHVPGFSKALHWNLLSPVLEGAIRDLRADTAPRAAHRAQGG